MGNIVGKQFKVVASKNLTDSLADSVKEGNQAKFYLAQDGLANGKALDDVTIPDELTDRNVLIINGNKIQGVNQKDLSKLDAITDVTKIFKYKGSVETGAELLEKVPPETEVGDVWNVEQECEINGVQYPAHTNFVCSSVQISIDGKPATSTWDSLGGTMQIGAPASVTCETNNMNYTVLHYSTKDNLPINGFPIILDSNTGIFADNDGKISLELCAADVLDLEHHPNGYDSLVISTTFPINAVKIPIGSGLNVSTSYGIDVKLSGAANNNDEIGFDWNNSYRNSGLDISTNGLFIAISSSGTLSSKYIPNGLKCVGIDNVYRLTGGLILDGDNIVDWLKINKKLEPYINSLIDAKLKAQ